MGMAKCVICICGRQDKDEKRERSDGEKRGQGDGSKTYVHFIASQASCCA